MFIHIFGVGKCCLCNDQEPSSIANAVAKKKSALHSFRNIIAALILACVSFIYIYDYLKAKSVQLEVCHFTVMSVRKENFETSKFIELLVRSSLKLISSSMNLTYLFKKTI